MTAGKSMRSFVFCKAINHAYHMERVEEKKRCGKRSMRFRRRTRDGRIRKRRNGRRAEKSMRVGRDRTQNGRVMCFARQ